jgi:hypothetical protein
MYGSALRNLPICGNIYAAGFLSGMIGSKGDLKQGILGALTAGCSLHNCICCNSGYCKGIGYRDQH